MGRHTKLADADAPDEMTPQPSATGRMKWITKVPLLPAVAGAVAICVCAAAWSTSQISLNFAGGGSARQEARGNGLQDSAARNGGGGRADGVVIAFRASARQGTQFTGTVAIANRGDRPVNGWTLAFKIPNAKVLLASNAVLLRPGATVASLRNPAYAPTIRPGETIRMTFVARGAAARPSACYFNRTSCGLKPS